jgi:hypothetical protein
VRRANNRLLHRVNKSERGQQSGKNNSEEIRLSVAVLKRGGPERVAIFSTKILEMVNHSRVRADKHHCDVSGGRYDSSWHSEAIDIFPNTCFFYRKFGASGRVVDIM